LATVPKEDQLLVEETPAFMAPLIPFAALILPSKFDKKQIGIYIVTRPKDMENLGKHLNYANIPGTAFTKDSLDISYSQQSPTGARLFEGLVAEQKLVRVGHTTAKS